jgi:hypothetical protein
MLTFDIPAVDDFLVWLRVDVMALRIFSLF